jgi:hypothetical protein
MNDVNGLLGGIGAVFGGLAGVAALIAAMHRSKEDPEASETEEDKGPAPDTGAPGSNPLLRTAYAAATLAIAAFVVALVVIYEGLTPYAPLLQIPRFVAEFCGILSIVAGFLVVLPLHRSDKTTAEIGGLALLTGFAVLTGMFVVA